VDPMIAVIPPGLGLIIGAAIFIYGYCAGWKS
jgi:hypothetical protein